MIEHSSNPRPLRLIPSKRPSIRHESHTRGKNSDLRSYVKNIKLLNEIESDMRLEDSCEMSIVPDVSHVINYTSRGGSSITKSALRNPRSKLRHKIDLTHTSAAKKMHNKRSANQTNESIASVAVLDPSMQRFLEQPDSPEDQAYMSQEITVKKTKAQEAEEKNLEFSQ